MIILTSVCLFVFLSGCLFVCLSASGFRRCGWPPLHPKAPLRSSKYRNCAMPGRPSAHPCPGGRDCLIDLPAIGCNLFICLMYYYYDYYCDKYYCYYYYYYYYCYYYYYIIIILLLLLLILLLL